MSELGSAERDLYAHIDISVDLSASVKQPYTGYLHRD